MSEETHPEKRPYRIYIVSGWQNGPEVVIYAALLREHFADREVVYDHPWWELALSEKQGQRVFTGDDVAAQFQKGLRAVQEADLVILYAGEVAPFGFGSGREMQVALDYERQITLINPWNLKGDQLLSVQAVIIEALAKNTFYPYPLPQLQTTGEGTPELQPATATLVWVDDLITLAPRVLGYERVK